MIMTVTYEFDTKLVRIFEIRYGAKSLVGREKSGGGKPRKSGNVQRKDQQVT